MSKQVSEYKKAIEEVEAIITSIENNEVDFEELLKKVKRGTELLDMCREKLTNIEQDIENIIHKDHAK
jgi:exodeoxyribonuclease VII small subunit